MNAKAALLIGKTMNKKWFCRSKTIDVIMFVLDIGDCLRASVFVCIWHCVIVFYKD